VKIGLSGRADADPLDRPSATTLRGWLDFVTVCSRFRCGFSRLPAIGHPFVPSICEQVSSTAVASKDPSRFDAGLLNNLANQWLLRPPFINRRYNSAARKRDKKFEK
jgi:hypothetical protein